MRRILKYEVEVSDRITRLPLAKTDTFLHAAEQNGRLVVWYEVEPHGPLCGAITPEFDIGAVQVPEERYIQVVPTGHTFGDNFGSHLVTVLMANGQLVWHLYEVNQ